jgi:glycogen phosphorylase
MTPRERASFPPPADLHDGRLGLSPDALRRAVFDHLHYTCAKDQGSATLRDLYLAMAHAMRDRLLSRWLATRATYRRLDVKRVYYLSAEYLLGRTLAQNLDSLGIYEIARDALAERGLSLADLLEFEPDPGLGNGGLGRLAACFLDSMATLGIAGFGYGIRYEYGIFEQRIVGGEQVELGDAWLRYGNPWEIPRQEYTVEVRFEGHVEERHENGRIGYDWVEGKRVLGVPYDVPIAGYRNGTVNTLRLWSAQASRDFDLQLFNAGDFRRAVEEKVTSETISRVLYPADHSAEGKELRLKQQYFFVACSIQDILRRYRLQHDRFDQFADKVAIQLNDTHPSIAIAELMRVLLDQERVPWDQALAITQAAFGYTNHTLMPEALERWPVSTFERLLPRHLSIIYEMNARLLRRAHIQWPGDVERQRRISIIEEAPERSVRMAHLAAFGSHKINGVAALHSDLVRTRLLPEFAALWPERFVNETNGVSPRRWLLAANRPLAEVFDRRIGPVWRYDMHRLRELASLADDSGFQEELAHVKHQNKAHLARYVLERTKTSVDPASLFVVQVKRMHEYKRQLLACLHIILMYRRLKRDPSLDVVPMTFIFGGKAAPGYAIAKQHIRLIHDIGSIVNDDPVLEQRLRVVFVPNYGVSAAERIIPAADVSLQISLAGTEASGTGNMKLGMNGALTVGTLDGANIEIREQVGEDNFFLFGLREEDVTRERPAYSPAEHIARSEALTEVIETLRAGFFSPDDPARTRAIADYLEHHDPFLCCADFDDYVACQDRVGAAYRDRPTWMHKVVMNVARLGTFSSDETIRRYARDIWGVEPVVVEESPPSSG